jgi:exopolyphosphatase/guanosine-5'-triphosphate,3'-diphosphate pyrophosphatase
MEYWLKKFIKPYQPSYILGTGGNINKVADYFQKSKYISHLKLTEFYKTIKEVSVEDRIEKYKMNQDRAEVIVPALEIFHFIMVQSGAEKVRPSTLGLKEGIVLDWLKKN